MGCGAVELRAVTPAEGDAAKRVLGTAFADDPMFHWCFESAAPGYEERVAGYLEAGHAWHVGTGKPVHGAFSGDELIGVIYAMDPEGEADAEQLRLLLERMRSGCGEESTGRFERYNRAVDQSAPEAPHHGVALVGVVPRWQGRGVGSRLMRWMCRRADADRDSAGVLLDTGVQRNLAFYARFGFDVRAEVHVEGLREWVLTRPRGG